MTQTQFIAARWGFCLAHHLDVDGEAASLATNWILDSPADLVRTQWELGLDGHLQCVGLLHAAADGAGSSLAGIALHADQRQLFGFTLDPAQSSLQSLCIELRCEVKWHLGRMAAANVASRILGSLRTGIHAHLIDAAHIGTIWARLVVDYLRVGASDSQHQAQEQSRKMQHLASNGEYRMRCIDDLIRSISVRSSCLSLPP